MKTSTSRTNLSRLGSERRLAIYGLAAGAALAAGATQADATLVTLDLTGLSTSSRTTPVGGNLYFDVNAASAAAAVGTASFAGADFRLQNFGTPTNPQAGIYGLGGNQIAGFSSYIPVFKASQLSASDHIGPNSSRSFNGAANIVGFPFAWGTNATGYLGLQFVIGSDVHYGWANITTNPDATVTLNALGYESDPDTAAHAEAPSQGSSVPDGGSSLALLAIGAAGLLAFRARQQKLA